MKKQAGSRRAFTCERLEGRLLLSGNSLFEPLDSLPDADSSGFHPVIVAGDPNGTPTDSPTLRVDANTSTSPFAGVGSLQINTTSGTYICTATPFDTTHVLSAGHCLDINNDGRLNTKDGILGVTFHLNLDTDSPTDQVDVSIGASSYRIHPDYTGFARPSVNDDVSVITLGSALPAGVPTYPLRQSPLVAGSTRMVMVGYGRSGTGVSGYTTGASFTIKRDGENMVDAFYGQDDRRKPAGNEVFRFDFDGPSGSGSFGGPTLGNNIETTLGGGDSGGPSFVLCGGCDPSLASSYSIAGVNTFTQGSSPLFGSLGGGMAVPTYANWILTGSSTSQGGGGGSGNDGGSALGLPEDLVRIVVDTTAPQPVSPVSLQANSERDPDSDTTAEQTLNAEQEADRASAGQPATVEYATATGANDSDSDMESDRLLRAIDDLFEAGIPVLV